MRLLTVVPVIALSALAVTACRKDPEPEPVYPVVTATTPAPAPVGTNATPVAAAQAPFLGVVIQAAAAVDTRGMQTEGGPFAGQFQQGQVLDTTLQGEPGRCYTVVGAGGPGVQELDIQFLFQPLPMAPPTIVSQDNMTGPQATLGGGGNCVKNPAPMGVPVTVRLKVVSGSGYAAAQIYKK